MAYLAANNANSTLSVGLGGTIGDTTLQIQVGDVSKFPVVNNGGTGSDYTLLTLTDSSGNKEIVKVNRHDTGSASFTIERGQEGTAIRVWQAGDSVSLRLTAGVVTQTYTHPGQATGAHAASAISVTPTGNIGSNNVQAALAELDTEKADSGHTHNASAIVFTPAGNIAATTVAGALAELDSEKLPASAVTSAGLALIDDADAAAQRATLGIGNGGAVNTASNAVVLDSSSRLPAVDGSQLTGITTLPSQTGNNGKYLTTNGTAASWATISALLTSDFTGSNVSLAANGYQKLPSGLIIQWGTATASGSSGTITFPVAFTTACYSIAGQQNNAGATQYCAFGAPSTTSVTFYGGGTNIVIFWIAIGK